MYLTKVSMPLQSRRTVDCLQDCQKMHGFITGMFSSSRSDQNILYRINSVHGQIQIYMYSDGPVQNIPEGVSLCGQRDISEWADSFSDGQVHSFDLIASPTKKVKSETGKNSQRRILRDPEDRLKWLNRKAEQNGFVISEVSEEEQSHSVGRHKQELGGVMVIDAYHYQGVLQVTDAVKFRKALRCGIGPGKAYGLGMLMVK